MMSSKMKLIAFAVSVLLIGLPFSAEAEEEERLLELEEIVITGTKTERVLEDVPVRTEVITSRELEEKGAATLYEALEGIPGIRVEQQCSYCNFSVVRMQGLESGHVQVLIDGQPIFSGLAGVYGLEQIPTANIERIEIVKGAGSALYGSNAIAGVINIITKKPTEESAVEMTTRFGTDNTNAHTIAASTRTGNMEIMITAQKNSGDEIDEDGDNLTDRVKTDNVAGGVRINWYDLFGEDDQLSVSGRTIDETRKGGELDTFANPFAEGAENITTTRYETGIGYRRKLLSDNEFGINFAYCTHHRSATNDSFLGDYMGTHDDAMPPVNEMRPYGADEKLAVLDANYAHLLGEKHRLLVGAQYTKNELEEEGKYCIVDEEDADYGKTYLSTSEKSADEIGIYLQDEFSISENLELVAGIRYDIHDSKDDFAGSGDVEVSGVKVEYNETALNPRLALMYKISPELTLRGSAGTGFRVPYGFSEDLHLCSGSPRVNKPADLSPEKSVSASLGIDYRAEKYVASANIFRTNLEDKIGFADASEETKAKGYTYQWENIGDAYTQGIELGLVTTLAQDLTLDFNTTYTDAQYEDERTDWVDNQPEYASESKYIPRVPVITAGANLTYAPSDWKAALNVNYTGSMYIDYCEEDDITNPGSEIKHTDGFVVVNTKVARSFPQAGVTGFVGVKNLFDYVQDDKRPDDAAFMWAPYTGRMIYAGMEIKL